MANPYDGLSATDARKLLAEVRAQLGPMRAEAQAVNAELASGRKTVSDIEAAGRRGARIGAGAARTPAAEIASADTLAARTKQQIALETRYSSVLENRERQMGLLARTQRDLGRAQLAEVNAANAAAGAPPGAARQALVLEQQKQQRLIQQKLLPREAERAASVEALTAELGVIERELVALNQTAEARARNLALQQQQVKAAIALKAATYGSVPPQLGPGGGGGPLTRYNPYLLQNLHRGGLPPTIGGPFPGGFGQPQRQLPPGGQPFGLLPSGLPANQKLLPAQTGITAAAAATNQRVAASTTQAASATGLFSSNLQRNQAILAASSQEMRKFGSLTTEFIGAAGRGAVTVRELGFQVSSTIGKFGGWLAAGTAVYGAFGALQAVGKGAIDAQSGVSQLQRVVNNVDADKATQQFRDLAGEFNLPIEEVSNAAFEMGKVFDNQNDSLEATRSILASVKVGELDVATSSRYLTSIIQAFNLDAGDMAGVFDQVNQAQNTFGIRIEDTLAGLAKSSGTFKAAGGDISTLLALITTARRATGQTGEVIGTAIARSPNFLRQESNQATLRQFGIDPTENIVKVYTDAFDVAKSLSGKKVQELAAAIGGPQYGARIFTPLLQQGELFNKVLRDTSPEASKGSAQQELQSVLAQTNEQLQKVINQLQIFGAGLSRAGAFDAFGLLLKLLNATLVTANGIVSIFNSLPEPIRKAVTYMGQFAAAVALARRLNVGEGLSGRAGSFLTRRNQEAFRYREGLIAQRDTLAREAEGASQAAVRKSLNVETARAALAREQAALASVTTNIKEGQVVTEEQQIAATQRTVAAENQLAAAREAELAAITRNQTILRESLVVESQLTALRRTTTDAEARRLADAHGVLIPGAIGPSSAEARRLSGIGRGLSGQQIGSTLQEPGLTTALLRQTGLPNAGEGGVFNARGLVSKQTDGLRDRIRQYGLLGGTIATGNRKIVDATRAADIKLRSLSRADIGTAARNMGTSLRTAALTVGSFIGPLDILLIGGFILADQLSRGNERIKQIDESLKGLNTAQSAGDFDKNLQSIFKKVEDDPRHFGSATLDQNRAEAEALERADELGEERRKEIVNLLSRVGGRPTEPAGSRLLFAEDYKGALDSIVTSYQDSAGGAKALAKGANALVEQVRKAKNLTDKEKADLIAQVRSTVSSVQGLRASYEQTAATAGEGLGQTISDYSSAVGTGFGNRRQTNLLIQQALIQVTELSGSNKPADAEAIGQALSDMAGALDDAAQTELDFSLAFAKGQQERNAAYSRYLQATSPEQIRNQTRGLIDEQRQKLKRLGAEETQLRRELPAAGLPQGLRGAGGGADEGAIRAELRDRGKTQKEIRERIKKLRESQEEAIKQLRLIRQEQREERFAENQALIQARGDLRESQANEGLPALRVTLSTINRLLADAIKHYGRNSKEVLDLLGQQQDARDAIIDEQLSLIQAQGDYRTAGFAGQGQETQRAQSEIDGMERQLAFMQAHPQQYSQADILGLQAQIREAQAQLAETAQQEAEDLRDALFDIQIARANARGNDVAAARAELAKALFGLRQADTKQERREARADVINQRAAVRQSIFDREVEDIQFQADIGRLTLTEQIRAYQGLLKTLTLNRDQRRDLKRRIEQLKNQAEQDAATFDLDLGSIKLPTVYEIRRAIQGGINTAPNVSMTQTNTFNVTGSNADEIVDKVARKQNEAAKRGANMSRSAGLRG